MLHLTAERLAALADGHPTPAEAAHLAVCRGCAHEREVYRGLVGRAREARSAEAAPLVPWETVRGALVAEGLTSGAASSRDGGPVALDRPGSRLEARRTIGPWLRAAAAVMLVACGAVAGRLSARVEPGPVVAGGSDTATVSAVGTGAGAAFRSREDALAALTSAEQQYQRASMFLAAYDTTANLSDSSDIYRTRLAALDGVMAASRQALREAPHDPVINRYYLATVGAREVTMQQLNTVLPVNMKVQRF